MAESEVTIVPSVLDRLLDFEPKVLTEAPKSRSKTLRELKQSVRRDLEWLLNSRYKLNEIPEDLTEVNSSLAVYGLPDFTSISSINSDERTALTQNVEKTLRLFEPRFANLRVTLEEINEVERGVKFRIQASLLVEPAPEPVVFDTILKVGSSEISIKANE